MDRSQSISSEQNKPHRKLFMSYKNLSIVKKQPKQIYMDIGHDKMFSFMSNN